MTASSAALIATLLMIAFGFVTHWILPVVRDQGLEDQHLLRRDIEHA
jgi:hypothetical protein